MTGPTASVVVPTRDRPAALAVCLQALADQTVASELEVIVVDDGSANARRVEEIATAGGAVITRTEGVGPAAARNRGVAVARGRIVLLTDDDCIPSPRWAELLIAALTGGHDRVVRGTTVPSRPDDVLLVANEVIVEQLAQVTPFAATSNLACPRALLLEQPFDERFPLAAGEDREWCLRLVGSGTAFAHVPDAVVLHDPTMTLGSYWRRHVRYGRAARLLATLELSGSRPARPISLYVGLLTAGFRAGPRVGGAVLVAQLATALGYVRETVSSAPSRSRD